MSVPKSVIKINKDGVKYVSNVDRARYTLKELTRAALRDVGKYVCKKFKTSYYSRFKRKTGKVGKFVQYWVRNKQPTPNLQVGIKANGFYGGFQELGTSKLPKMGLLSRAVENNIAEIVKIESQYLSALEKEAKALALINANKYEGDADG